MVDYVCDSATVEFFSFHTVSSGGILTYSQVTMFLKQPNQILKYQSITTVGNETLSLTGNHLVYARKCNSDQFIPV